MQSTTSSTRTFITKTEADKKSEKPPKAPRRKLFTKKSLPWLIIVLLIVVSGLLYWQYQQARQKLDTNQQLTVYEKRLGKIILLPAGEKPITTATVKDAKALSSILFYKNAQNGDIVFVYAKEHLAILYRPSTNMIINITTDVNISSTSQKSTSN